VTKSILVNLIFVFEKKKKIPKKIKSLEYFLCLSLFLEQRNILRCNRTIPFLFLMEKLWGEGIVVPTQGHDRIFLN